MIGALFEFKGLKMADDTTDPIELLMLESRVMRKVLHDLVEQMKAERLEWDRRLNQLGKHRRLTTEQRDRLSRRTKREKPKDE